MPQTVEAIYHDGVVELKQMPSGIRRAKALVIFLDDSEEATEHHAGTGAGQEDGKESLVSPEATV